LAEGDKVVPSGGNQQLDPTRENKWSNALNSKLGVTQGSLTDQKYRSGSLSSSNFVRNQNGLLVAVGDVEMDVARQANMRRNRKGSEGWTLSESDILDRGKKARDLRAFKPEKSAASPEGEEEEEEEDTGSSPQIYRKPRPFSGPRLSTAFNGTFGTMKFKSPVLQGACDGKVGQFPLQTLLPQCAGPFLPLVFSTQGGTMQSSAPEAMNKGIVVNQIG
jgi:hypothetical protein